MDRQRAMTDKEIFKFKLEKANNKIDELKHKVKINVGLNPLII